MAFDLITPIKIARGELPTIIGTLYTVPSLSRTIVKSIDLANSNSSPVTVTLHLVPDGSGPSDATLLIPTIYLGANSMFQWGGAQVLNEGDTIQALASTTGVSINTSGGECI